MLIGRNGAGKTTTLRSVMAIARPKRGRRQFPRVGHRRAGGTEERSDGAAALPRNLIAVPGSIDRMTKGDIEVFSRAFAEWTRTFLLDRRLPPISASEYEAFHRRFRLRVPEDVCALIGSGLRQGLLSTVRGFFVHLNTDPRKLATQYVFHGREAPHPCWELYVQLAEAVRWAAIATELRLDLKMEDRLMDVTLSHDETLVVYVEAKVDPLDADALVRGVTEYGRIGVPAAESVVGAKLPDALKKARYLTRHRPKIFSVRALGYATDWYVIYVNENGFALDRLSEDPDTAVRRAVGELTRGAFASLTFSPLSQPRFDPIDTLAAELTVRCPSMDIGPGTGATAYNVKLPIRSQNHIVLGVYRTGEIWTDLQAFLPDEQELLAGFLEEIGIKLTTGQSWSFWRADGRVLRLADVSAERIAEQVGKFVDALSKRIE